VWAEHTTYSNRVAWVLEEKSTAPSPDPAPNGGGTWGGGMAPSPDIFSIFWLKIMHFGVHSDKE